MTTAFLSFILYSNAGTSAIKFFILAGVFMRSNDFQNNKPIRFIGDLIEIKDLSILSAIYAAGEREKAIKRDNGSLYFVFENQGAALRIASAYIANAPVMINLSEFVQAQKQIKEKITMRSGNYAKHNR